VALLDVVNQFTLQIWLGLGAFAIGFFVWRARVLTGIVIVLSGLIAIGLYPQLVSEVRERPVAVAEGQRALKVMSFNMSLWNREPALVLAEVKRINPDILTLIEISPSQQGLMADLRALYPHALDCTKRPGCYFAMFSRVAFSPVQLKTNWRTPPSMGLRLGPEFGELTVMAVHTLRFPHARGQLIQMRALVELLGQIEGPKLVMGDFNATAFSSVLQDFTAQSRLERFSYLPSWPSTFRLPQLGIDHVFGSAELALIERERIGHYAGSDHYPIYLTVGVGLAPR
jgi:endonuclease/exonuclease/phosphatase (EEP) superfamily protein YafD